MLPAGATNIAGIASGRIGNRPALEPAGSAPVSVLLVEDNQINQLVATAMLARLGLSVTLATGGAEAVKLVQEHAFSMVLMDCQMPGMDGLEATRRIRAWEQATRAPPLPIVALTANAMDGDREACLAAGMSDYIAKPLSGAALEKLVTLYIAPEPALPEPDTVPVFDAAVLASLPMVADGSEPDFPRILLEHYLRDSSDIMVRCAEAAAACDGDVALRGVHTLKSSSAEVGALALAAFANALEGRMRTGRRIGKQDLDGLQAE